MRSTPHRPLEAAECANRNLKDSDVAILYRAKGKWGKDTINL